ncbi:MAG: aspartyl protease family protein [Terracidiphilus sp.]|jgi:predicted aspartyl protease
MPGRVSLAKAILRAVLLIALLWLPGKSLFAVSCSLVKHPAPSLADKALLGAEYEQAAILYRGGLRSHPGDAELTKGLVHALLHEEKTQDAADAVKASLAVAPNSAALIMLRGEVELRQGMPWTATETALEAFKLDPCNSRTRLLLADLDHINSLFASSRKELDVAHRLDPEDPEIRREWIHTLTLQERIAETEAYLAAPRGEDEEELFRWRLYLANLKKMAAEPHKTCRLVSPTASTEIPFAVFMRDSRHISAFGLEAKLNGRSARLEIDTGADGLVISHSVAEHAHLKAFSQTQMSGVGDQADKLGYTAYADSIRIGNLEFQDCAVRVLDSKSGLDEVDGLIGMDVFSHFLVTLDFPMRKLLLGPLPPRPGEAALAAPSLKTSDEDRDDAVAPAQHGAVQKSDDHGPYDRYIAPEMKSYTPVYRVGHLLMLPAALNGQKLKLFALDTGSMATTISPEAAREVTKVRSSFGFNVKGINGKVENVYAADEVTFTFAHVSQKVQSVVSIDTSRISKDTGMEISGFLGANTLDQLTIHIDYRDGLVKFDYDPNRGYRY